MSSNEDYLDSLLKSVIEKEDNKDNNQENNQMGNELSEGSSGLTMDEAEPFILDAFDVEMPNMEKPDTEPNELELPFSEIMNSEEPEVSFTAEELESLMEEREEIPEDSELKLSSNEPEALQEDPDLLSALEEPEVMPGDAEPLFALEEPEVMQEDAEPLFAVEEPEALQEEAELSFALEEPEVMQEDPDLLFALEESEALPEEAEQLFVMEEPVVQADPLSDFAIQEPDIDEIDSMEMNETESETEELDFMALTEPGLDESMEEGEHGRAMSEDEIDAIFQAADVAAHSDQVGEEEEDLAEINGLLQHSESDDESDDDMLALLESMAGEKTTSNTWHDDENEEKSEETEQSVDSGEENQATAKKEESKNGFFSNLFGKKNKKKAADEEPLIVKPETDNLKELDEAELSDQVEFEDLEYHDDEFPVEGSELGDLDDIREVDELEGKKKSNGFFSKIFAFLTDSDDDEDDSSAYGMEPSEENKTILDELDQEDKKKKKKKAKGKGEDDLESGVKDKKSKNNKKPKKEKIPKVKKEEPVVAGKRISPKKIAMVIALSVTLLVVVIMISVIVPTYYEKRGARNAYTEADYSTSYLLLYGKKLDSSDELIYQKSRVIMEMKRKLDSYHNYLSLGLELEALDALMSGVKRYPEIYTDAQTYNVTNEVDAVYSTILSLLKDHYRLEASMAEEINGYQDDRAYTRRLKSIVFGTPYVDPADENAEKLNQKAADAADNQTNQAVVPEVPAEEIAPEAQTENQQTEPDGQEETTQEQADVTGQENGNTEEAAAPQEQDVTTEPTVNEAGNANQGQVIEGVRQPVEIKINGN